MELVSTRVFRHRAGHKHHQHGLQELLCVFRRLLRLLDVPFCYQSVRGRFHRHIVFSLLRLPQWSFRQQRLQSSRKHRLHQLLLLPRISIQKRWLHPQPERHLLEYHDVPQYQICRPSRYPHKRHSLRGRNALQRPAVSRCARHEHEQHRVQEHFYL
jgi:hypothetical protein